MKDSNDPYEILGVDKNAEEKDIKKVFRKLAHKYHPDKSNLPNSAKIFNKVLSAYEVLKDNDFKYCNKNINVINLNINDIRKKMEKYEKDGLFNSDYSDYIKGKMLWGMTRKKR